MSSLRKNSSYKLGMLIFILLLSFVFCILTYNLLENILLEKLSTVIGVINKNSRDIEILAMNQLKAEHSQYTISGKEVLKKYGYNSAGFIFLKDKKKVIYISLLFSILITFIFYSNMKISGNSRKKNIEKLKNYLENTNKGDYSLNLSIDEDFTILSDELYKTVVNLRELKKQAMQDKINLKENMADISHQLKTPITSINIMAQLMENNESKEESQEYINRLSKQIRRLETLTNSLLTMSKLDADAIEFKKETIEIKNIIDLAIEPIVYLIEKKDIQLNVIGQDITIKGDVYWLGEAFLNIIKNSVEHLNNNGEIDIFLESNPIFAEVKIEDNGSGFYREDLPYLFKRFYKGKNANKDSVGIGLSMSKTIIEKHNGEISAENRVEGGARFKVKFYQKI
ncbi:HAMP domain-containing histidine kinase [Tissierella carlieri]|uniref:sensor histidine kinase n=1 Tax=Tissierella carlieri TaxID=689904 RepID=UPI001C10F879|nr:HAMP domain-containing sensor histidine kinase [Tissierella carlieri]MBU5313994.1 HAMP domain-containing histidine kinase [Tissierella carlieri]